MKTPLLLLLYASVLAAGTITTPDLIHDGQSLNPASPGLGIQVLAVPGSSWVLGFNDNRHGDANDDQDFNDAYLRIVFGEPFTWVYYDLSLSAHQDFIRIGENYWLSQGTFAEYALPLDGQPLTVELWDTNTNEHFFSGPANWDGGIHAWVQGTFPPPPGSETPEPGTLLMIGLGLVVVGRRRG